MQITRTTPLRLMILHLGQIGLTDALTFMIDSLKCLWMSEHACPRGPPASCLEPAAGYRAEGPVPRRSAGSAIRLRIGQAAAIARW